MLIKAFVVGGLICVAGQILIDLTKLTPARILVTFVGRALYGLGRAERDPSWVNRMFYKFI